MRSFIDATTIEQYLSSDRRDGQELLAQLIDKLVTASIDRKHINWKRFPYGDQINLPGADGILVTDNQFNNQFIPHGVSLWEFGTSKEPKRKADDDFKSSDEKLAKHFSNLQDDIKPSNSTYIFVTSQKWGYHEWVRKNTNDSEWKDIRVYDSTDIVSWMEQCPVVMLWFCDVCGLPAKGLYDVNQYIKTQEILYNFELSPELVFAGRNKVKDELVEAITSSRNEIQVYGESVDEVALFLASLVKVKSDDFSQCPPMIFADKDANINLLATYNEPIIIVPLDCEVLGIIKAKNVPKWRIIIPRISGGVSGNTRNDEQITLGKCNRAALESYLSKYFDYSEHKVRQIVVDSKGSLAALFWILGADSNLSPKWVMQNDATVHASILLAGGWVESNLNDRKIIEKISGKSYREIENLIHTTLLPDGPWICQDGCWLSASKEYVWSQLASKITRSTLDNFQEIVIEVIGERDPSLDLEVSKRGMAQLLGKVRKYSGFLCKGLADSLARLAIVHSEGQRWANKIIRDLISPSLPDAEIRWISLRNVYSELAEAAPIVFLDSLEEILLKNPTMFYPDSSGTQDIFTQTSPHVFLLWALEQLAWMHEYFHNVLLILVKLAENAPNNIGGNNPLDSLVRILLPWRPQHSEELNDSVNVLDRMYMGSPDVTWKVAIGLLPKSHAITSPTVRPDYLGEVKERVVTNKEYWEFVLVLVTKMVSWCDSNPNRISELLEMYPDIQKGSPKVGKIIFDSLMQIDVNSWDDNDKAIVKETLNEMIKRHRTYNDADWALDEYALSHLDDINNKFELSDSVLKVKTYFTWEPNDPECPDGRYGYEWEKWISEKRISSCNEVYDQYGIDGVLRLAESVIIPSNVGQTTASIKLEKEEVNLIFQKALSISPDQLSCSPLLQFGRSYICTDCNQSGNSEEWLSKVLEYNIVWNDNIYSNLALCLPSSQAVWDKVKEWGSDVEKMYWLNVGTRFELRKQWEIALEKWKQYSNPCDAIELLAMLIERCDESEHAKLPSGEVVADLLQFALEVKNEPVSRHSNRQANSYYIEKLFCYLDSLDVDENIVSNLEWSYLRLLENSKRGIKVLYSTVCSSPDLFISILKLICNLDDDGNKMEQGRDSGIAQHGYHLLNGIHTIPGLAKTEDGVSVDVAKLKWWIQEARELADKIGIVGLCDSHIGKILSHAPLADDGIFPCVEVRDVIEDIYNKAIHDGFGVGVLNQRGAVFRGSGGKQEWELSKKYKEYADEIRIKWIKTASILDSIAKDYEEDAKKWDKRADFEEFS